MSHVSFAPRTEYPTWSDVRVESGASSSLVCPDPSLLSAVFPVTLQHPCRMALSRATLIRGFKCKVVTAAIAGSVIIHPALTWLKLPRPAFHGRVCAVTWRYPFMLTRQQKNGIRRLWEHYPPYSPVSRLILLLLCDSIFYVRILSF